MDSFESWNEFRKNESSVDAPLVCCECGKAAEGNVSCDDGEVCDACHARDAGEVPGECDCCGGELMPLGALGSRAHFCCRNCGMICGVGC